MSVLTAPAGSLALGLIATLLSGGTAVPAGAAAPAAEPMTTQSAAQARGRAIFADQETGHCILCHQHQAVTAAFQGNLGPDLTAVGSRLSKAEMRARIEDPTRLNPETVMPAYFRRSGLRQVGRAYLDRTILTAAQIDDLLAFLAARPDLPTEPER